MAVEEEDTWQKLPIDLQEQFYAEAEAEADQLLESLAKTEEAIESVRPLLTPYFRPLPRQTEPLTVAAVDGSRSVHPGEKLGARFTVFSVGLLIVQGLEHLAEPYYVAGRVRTSQAYSSDHLVYLLSLIEDLEERKTALLALEKGVDLVLLDGSFLGFSYDAFRARREGIMTESMEKMLRKTYDATRKLMESGRCVAVIKRSKTRALGGWLSYQQGKKHPLTPLLDKHILARLMPAATSLQYDQIFTQPGDYRVYSRFATRVLADGSLDFAEELAAARSWVVNGYRKALKISAEDATEILAALARRQVKFFADVAPFELEYPVGVEEDLLSRFLGNPMHFNEATGLPIALDMIDELVLVPREFTRDFTEEVEARITEKYRGDLDTVRVYFQNLNPQKEV